MPVTSPIAQRRSAARRCASTGTPWASGVDADRLQADPVDTRAPAGGDEQPVAAQLAAVVEREDVVLAVSPRRGRVHAEHELDALAAQDLAERLAQRRRLAWRARARRPSTSATSPPRRRTACAISTPTGPPPRMSRRRGTAFMPVASRLVQTPSSSRRPGMGGMNGSAPLASTTWSAVWRDAVDLDDAGAGEPAAAAEQVDAAVGQPALLPGVGVVRDHEVTPGQRRFDVDLGGRRRLARGVDRLARPQQGLRRDAGPVGALAAHQLALDDAPRAGRPRPARPRSARPASRRRARSRRSRSCPAVRPCSCQPPSRPSRWPQPIRVPPDQSSTWCGVASVKTPG